MSERILDKELSLQIRKELVRGTKIIDIQAMFDINENTWDSWYYRDTQGFRSMVVEAKKERLIRKSEKISEDILDMQAIDTEGKVASDLLRIMQKESEFIRETLDKDNYSKRTDLTTKDKAISFPTSINIVKPDGDNI